MKDNHGNTPFTPDLIITSNWEGKQFQYYYFSLQPFYQYANLQSETFQRYGFNLNWNFNKLIIDKTTLTIGTGLAVIHRPYPTISYQFNTELSYKLLEWLDVSLRNELIKRTDLPNNKLGYNLSFGIIIQPFK